MNRILQALLVGAVLLSQGSVVAAVCNCKAPAPVPAPREKVICPMSGEVGCTCCESEAPTPQNRACEMTASTPSPSYVAVLSPVIFELDTWILPTCLVLSAPATELHSVHVWCTLHGHDPPDRAGHGLRAPPAS